LLEEVLLKSIGLNLESFSYWIWSNWSRRPSTYSSCCYFCYCGICGEPLQKAPSFQSWSGYSLFWQDCSSSEYASIDAVGFSIWRHTFKMAAMTSFRAEKVLPPG